MKKYIDLIFKKLHENIGNVIVCISYIDGLKKETSGILKEVCDNYYITIGNEKHVTDIIPFMEEKMAILSIMNDNEILYLNNEIKDGYNMLDSDEVKKYRDAYFGKEEKEYEPLTFKEKKALYTLAKTNYHDFEKVLSVNGYNDDKLNVYKENSQWKVDIQSGDKRYFLRDFSNILEACFYCIMIMSTDVHFQKDRLYDFCKMLLEDSDKLEIEAYFNKETKIYKK